MKLEPAKTVSEGAHEVATGYQYSTLRPSEGCERVIYLPPQLTEDWGAAPRASYSTHTPIVKADDQ